MTAQATEVIHFQDTSGAEQRRGYAIKRRFKVVAFFTAQRKRLSTSDQ